MVIHHFPKECPCSVAEASFFHQAMARILGPMAMAKPTVATGHKKKPGRPVVLSIKLLGMAMEKMWIMVNPVDWELNH